MRHLALSIKQPYASKILDGSKPVEFRSWQTHHRGDIVICASKSPQLPGLPTGCMVCLAELHNITRNSNTGMYSWHLRNIRPLKQKPVKGQCRLFYVDL
jgi:hypothetical protein